MEQSCGFCDVFCCKRDQELTRWLADIYVMSDLDGPGLPLIWPLFSQGQERLDRGNTHVIQVLVHLGAKPPVHEEEIKDFVRVHAATDEQVCLDYKGVHDYLTIGSVVVFHNAMYLFNGIKDAFKYGARENFDTFKMLKTFGNTAIFYDSDTWPEITDYLKANSLVWEDWKKYARYLENLDVIDKYFKLKQKPYYNFLIKLLRLRNGHRG